jgi:hypothetical protein
MKTKRIAETVYTTIYVTDDGKEFRHESDARNHENRLNGVRMTCSNCNGNGKINIKEDTCYMPGYPPTKFTTGDRCPKCDGKGYLEKVTEWK